jgi:hypothetical protein
MNPELQLTLPKQLRDQLAQAESLRSQMGDGNAPDGTSLPQGEAQDAISPQTGTGQPPALENAPTPSDGDLSWEQRFRSLQGRHEQSQRNNQALADRIGELENLVASMRASGADSGTSITPSPANYKLLTPEEETDYGEEMLSVVGKRAREELTPEVETLKQRLERLEGRVEGVGNVMARTEQQKMYDNLNHDVPNWQQINVDQGFKDWLQVPDPYSGRKRHDMLMDAFTRQDTQRVIQFFKGFAEVTGTPTTPESPRNVAPPLNNGSGQKPSLADYAAPGRARSGLQEMPPEKPVYTNAQIARFYADRRVGKWKGREAEADLIERDIFQAQHEGRIQ